MSRRALEWLDRHEPDVPPSLHATMREAVRGVAADGRCVADVLADAALACLRDALEDCDERAAAQPLLAADALVTAACAAALDDDGHANEEADADTEAPADRGTLTALCERLRVDRITDAVDVR